MVEWRDIEGASNYEVSNMGTVRNKTTQKELANTLSCTQSCIAKNHNRILNLIRKSLEY